MWLRVNTGKGSVEDYERLLHDAALKYSRGPGEAIRLDEPVPVSRLPGFAEGRVSVQDAAAQIAAPWLLNAGAPAPRILDACAAPGNKSSHLLERAGDDARLTAIDVDAGRLESVHANFERLGQSATVLEADASKPEEWWNGEPFDLILLDAPCSASGVIRRHPDIKLLRRPGDIERLTALQGRILGALWALLRPGGRLLYVTCSVFAAENDAVVGRFLAATPDAREDNVLPNNNVRDVMQRKACGYQVLPGESGLDGFYFASIEKRPAGGEPGTRESQPEQGSTA
jgi:16S rRNA (cytosine967-C5)-methyltransferase